MYININDLKGAGFNPMWDWSSDQLILNIIYKQNSETNTQRQIKLKLKQF